MISLLILRVINVMIAGWYDTPWVY